jgi:hypothetical protein
MMALYKSRIIQSSQALTADLIRPGALAMPSNQKLSDLERIRVQAEYAQLLPIGIWHREGQGPRSIGKFLKRISHMLRICSGPKDIVRILLNHALGPKDLVDKTTGADYSLPGLIRTQAGKLSLRS